MLSEYNDNGNMREIPSSDKEFNDKEYIKTLAGISRKDEGRLRS